MEYSHYRCFISNNVLACPKSKQGKEKGEEEKIMTKIIRSPNRGLLIIKLYEKMAKLLGRKSNL